MLFFFILIFVGFIAYRIRKQHKQKFTAQWQLAASSLSGFRCIPGGSVTGYPSLTGLIEGQRIDVAPFFHQEFGNDNTRMTGYRVRCDVPIELPGEAITSLTNHFQKFEVDERRIFCATYGVEQSSSTLVAKIRKIESAIRLAAEERERLAAELLAKSKAEIEAIQMKKQAKERKNQSKAATASLNPPPLPAPVDEEPPLSPVFLPMDVDGDEDQVEDAIEVSETTANEPEPEPEAAPESSSEPPVPRAPASHDPLTRAALDLFAAGRNKFEITRHFDGEYNNCEIDGQGTLQRVDTYSNDRTFGRGPGVVVEIEVPLPEAPRSESDDEENDSPLSSREKRPGSIRLRVALPTVEDVLPSSQARELREYVGDEVELVGTLCRCDPFDSRLHLCDGVIG